MGTGTLRRRRAVRLIAIATAALSVAVAGADAAVVAYSAAGSAYGENFDVLSSTNASPGFGWENGAATSSNSVPNSSTGTAGIAGFYVFGSTVAGATPDFNATPQGPRNFAGPDAIAPANWAAAARYFASGNTGSRLYSFGVAGTNPTTDRALGTLSGSTANNGTNGANPGDTYLALVLQNNTGQTLDRFTLTYYGERWRDGGATVSPQGYLFSYLVTPTFTGSAADIVTVPSDTNGDPVFDAAANNNGFGPFTRLAALDYAVTAGSGSLAAVDGNAGGNRTLISATVDATWAPNAYLVLRWFDNDENGTDLGLGIDDLSFSAEAVPEPATLGLVVTPLLLLARYRPTKRMRR